MTDVDVLDGVATVRLDHPPVNALDLELLDAIVATMGQWRHAQGARPQPHPGRRIHPKPQPSHEQRNLHANRTTTTRPPPQHPCRFPGLSTTRMIGAAHGGGHDADDGQCGQ